MRKVSLIVLIVSVAMVSCLPKPEDQYTSKYDNIDVDEILHSERLLKNYVNCLLDKGRCTPAGQELKTNLPDGIANGCKKCSPQQQRIGKKVLRYLIEEKPEYYTQLEAKYDPDGTYKRKYKAELEKEGIKL